MKTKLEHYEKLYNDKEKIDIIKNSTLKINCKICNIKISKSNILKHNLSEKHKRNEEIKNLKNILEISNLST